MCMYVCMCVLWSIFKYDFFYHVLCSMSCSMVQFWVREIELKIWKWWWIIKLTANHKIVRCNGALELMMVPEIEEQNNTNYCILKHWTFILCTFVVQSRRRVTEQIGSFFLIFYWILFKVRPRSYLCPSVYMCTWKIIIMIIRRW